MESQKSNQAAAQTPEIHLTAVIEIEGEKPQKEEFQLNSDKNRLGIGRDRKNEICVLETAVSLFHATLVLQPDARIFLSDLQSRTGTFLNGKRLELGETYELNDSDIVRVGSAEIRFNWEQPALPEILPAAEVQTATEDAKAEDSQPKPELLESRKAEEVSELIEDAEPQAAETPEIKADEKTEPKQQSVARSAGIVSIAVMGSRLMGLVREMVFAAYFGAGFLYDAYLVGFRIPNLLRDLFAEGALSAAFVKVFTDYQIKRSEEEAWRLASLVFNALVVVLSVITILAVIFSPQIVAVIAPGYSPEKAALASRLTQIMFPFIVLVAMAALAMGVLNTKGRFGIPASASTAFNIVSLIVGLAFAYFLSGGGWTKSTDNNLIPDASAQWAITGMAIGTLIGGAAQFLIQLPSLWKVGFRFSPVLNFRDEGVRQIGRLMAPALIGVSAVQIKVLIDTFMVSGINGGQSWLSYSFRLMQFPIGVFGVAVGTAAIPTLSRFAAQNDFSQFRKTLSNAMGLVFLMTIPSACGLIVLCEPIIRLIYERGEFDATDTMMTAWALVGYSIGLTGYAAIKVVSPSFYALDDAKTPMYVSVASIIVHLGVSYTLLKVLSGVGVTPETPDGLAHVGVTLATSAVATLNFLALAFIMRKRIERIEGRAILSSFGKIVAASALMSAVCYFSYWLLARFFGTEGLILRLIEAFVPIALGGAVFVAAAKFLGVRELETAINAFARKLRRSGA